MKQDQAVSPVIAVILLVALTVILAGATFLWVQDFSADQQSPRSLAVMSQGGNLTHAHYMVSSASPSLNWTDLAFSLSAIVPDGEVTAGQTFTVYDDNGVKGATLTVRDEPANAVILTLKIR